jgi:16S rRNA U516 pseudouridylate synthase RsuA-like enzyme
VAHDSVQQAARRRHDDARSAGAADVFDLLGPAARGLKAVGRLDMASAGLLLLTSDAQLGSLRPGAWRELGRDEIARALKGSGHSALPRTAPNCFKRGLLG